MHPLNYTLKDFEKMLENIIKIEYLDVNNQIVEISGKLIHIQMSNNIEIKPTQIILEIEGKNKFFDLFKVEKISH